MQKLIKHREHVYSTDVSQPDLCVVCGGQRHTLTTSCRGGLLYPTELDKIAKGHLDFYNGKWYYCETAGDKMQPLFDNEAD